MPITVANVEPDKSKKMNNQAKSKALRRGHLCRRPSKKVDVRKSAVKTEIKAANQVKIGVDAMENRLGKKKVVMLIEAVNAVVAKMKVNPLFGVSSL